MKIRKVPEITKVPSLWKAAAAGLAGLLTTAIYEAIKQRTFSNLTQWQSHSVTIVYCAILVFILSVLFLRHEEVSVRESKALNDSLMKSLPGVVCVFDASGSIKLWNTNFLGYSAAEIMKVGIISTAARESLRTVQQTMKTAFEQGVAESEALLVAKSGARIPCYLTGVRIVFQNEPCVLGFALDISKRKQAQEQIRLQSTALEAAANAVVITDVAGNIQWVNRAFTQLTGYTAEEAFGQNPRILKSGKHQESFYRDLWNTVLGGKVWHGEISNRKKDGQVYTEEMTIAPVLSSAGEIANFVAVKQDVTERNRLDAALRQSQEQFRQLAENIPEVFFAISLDPIRTTYISPAYDAVWGRSRQELEKDPGAWIEAVHPEDRERIGLLFAQSLEGHPVDMQFRIVRPDGSVRHLHSQAFPVLNSEGKPSRVVGFASDVTERQKAEELLQNSENKHRVLFENSADANLLMSEHGAFLDCNTAALRMFGLATKAELLALHPADLSPATQPDGTPSWAAAEQTIARAFLHGQQRFEWIHRHTGGHVFSAEVCLTALTLSGRPALLANVREITERKRAEFVLHQSEERFRRLVSNLPDVVWTRNQRGQTTYISSNVERVFGYTSQEISESGAWWLSRIHPQDRDRVHQVYQQLFSANQPFDIEFQIQRKDGVWIWVHDRAYHTHEIDGESYADGVLADITARKQADERLLVSEARLALKNQLARIFLTVPDDEMFGEVLGVILGAMNSECGLFGYIDEGVLVVPSLRGQIWEACKMQGKGLRFPREAWGGAWGRAIVEKTLLCSNQSGHVPEGHVPLLRHLVTPMWLMLARKSLLARLAVSAASLAFSASCSARLRASS